MDLSGTSTTQMASSMVSLREEGVDLSTMFGGRKRCILVSLREEGVDLSQPLVQRVTEM